MLRCDFIEPQPKDKLLVLIRMSPHPLFFVINSRSDRFSDGSVILRSAKYTFLRHDSFMDCSKILEWFTADEVHRQIEEEPGRIKGHLDRDDIDELLEAVSRTRQLSAVQKNLIMETFLAFGFIYQYSISKRIGTTNQSTH